MKNPRQERCLGKAIMTELASWMEVIDHQVEGRDSFQLLVKYPVNKI